MLYVISNVHTIPVVLKVRYPQSRVPTVLFCSPERKPADRSAQTERSRCTQPADPSDRSRSTLPSGATRPPRPPRGRLEHRAVCWSPPWTVLWSDREEADWCSELPRGLSCAILLHPVSLCVSIAPRLLASRHLKCCSRSPSPEVAWCWTCPWRVRTPWQSPASHVDAAAWISTEWKIWQVCIYTFSAAI